MRYTVYTKKKIINYPVRFKCEYCGKDNVSINPFVIEASYNDRGTITRRGLEAREHKADLGLMEKEAVLLEKIVDETRARNVKNTGYKCVCEYCKGVPKWSRFRNAVLEGICRFVCYIAFILALFFFLPIIEGQNFFLHYFWWPIGMVAATWLPLNIWYAIKTLRVRMLDAKYMPVLFEESSQEGTSYRSASQSFQNAVANGWVCTCGKNHPAYESSCVCGVTKAEAKRQNNQNT